MPAPHYSVFTGRISFLPPNQERQSTEVIEHYQKLIDNEESAKYQEGVNFPSLLGISGLIWSELQGGALSPTMGSAAGPL